MPSWRRGISGHMKNLNSIMQENYEEFISLTLRTRNWKKPLRMLARNWKRKRLPLCLARQARITMEASESTRMRMEESLPKYHEDHIAGKGDNSLQHYNLVHTFILMRQAMKIPAAKAAVDKEWENWKRFRRGIWRKSEVRNKWSMKQGRRALQFISPHWWTYGI